MALKETCLDYLVTILELFVKFFNKIDEQDFKFILAQCFQWYQVFTDLIREKAAAEKN